jgi:uncharacterized protein involved in exopolysaccharide biosynthesis
MEMEAGKTGTAIRKRQGMALDIDQLPGILLKRWMYIVATTLLCVALAAGYVVFKKPALLASATLLIDPQGLAESPSDPTMLRAAGAQDQSILESQVYVIQSQEVLDDVVAKLDLTKDTFLNPKAAPTKEAAMAATVAAMQKNILIERAGQSFVVEITFKHPDPVKAAKIANTIAEIYLKKVHDARSDVSSRASDAFELQAHELAQRLRKSEEKLEKFKAEHSIVSTGAQGLVIDQQVQGINQQLITAKADLEAKRAGYEQAKKLTVGSIEEGAMPEALASTALITMRANYGDQIANAKVLSTSLGANHPQMVAIRSRIASMKAEIEQELARIRESLKNETIRAEANVGALQNQLDELSRSSIDTSEAGIQARELESETEALRALYKTFLTRAEELGQRHTVNLNNSRIISRAVPIGASATLTKLLIVAAATLFGFALGSGVAVLRELAGGLFFRKASEAKSVPVAARPAPTPATAAEAATEVATAKPVLHPVIELRPAPVAPTRLRVANAVEQLLELGGKTGPSTVVVVDAGSEGDGARVVPELADALFRRHKIVMFSSGERGPVGNRALSPGLPLGNLLQFQRLSQPVEPRVSKAKPTFSHYSAGNRKADFVIIDANGSEARQHLTELLDSSNAILLVASDGDKAERVEGLMRSLAPWRNRMLGTVYYSNAA